MKERERERTRTRTTEEREISQQIKIWYERDTFHRAR